MDQLDVLKDLAVIFAVSVLVILVFHRLRLPALPGFIVAGMVLGPNALGLVTDAHRVEGLAEVGVILLLYTIGIEFSLTRLREMARQVIGGGLLQLGFTIAITTAVALSFTSGWRPALFLGILVALSSTAIVLKGLTDKGEIDAPHGRLATGVLIFQDLCVVPVMIMLPFLAGSATSGLTGLALALGKSALVVVGVMVAARTLVPRALSLILGTRSRELFLIAIILLGTLTALGTAAAGASLALGAFLAGLVISDSDYAHQAMAELLPFRDIFISIFFVAVGMLVDLEFLRSHPLLTMIGIAAVMGGKTLAAATGPVLMGYSGRVSLLAGLAVSQIGEFSFVLAKEGRKLDLLSDSMYQPFLAIAVGTMLITPFLVQGGPGLMDRVERWIPLDKFMPGFRPRGITPVKDTVGNHVIIAGLGLNGRNLASALRAIDVPHLIVELNSQSVRKARSRGEPAFYGDATREEILRALGIDRARLFVVAISDPAATRRMVRVARSLNPKIHIIARTRYIVEIAELTALGANSVIPEEFETSIEIFSRVLTLYEVPRHDIDRLAQQIRASHYEALRTPAQARPSLAGVVSGLPQMAAERVTLTAGAAAIGLTLAETQLRSLTGALVLSLSRGTSDIATPDPKFMLAEGDVLVVVGQPAQLKAARDVLLKAQAATT